MNDLKASLKLLAASLAVCAAGYPLLLWVLAQATVPGRAAGSLVRDAGGEIVGSALVAQEFHSPHYFWPRPSAAGYNAAAASGSNLSPANPALAERAKETLGALGADPERPAPPDLVTASGSGLDPHLTLAGALYQVPRVAAARGGGASRAAVARLVEERAFDPGAGAAGVRLVEVLALNLALDRSFPLSPPAP
jgi:K+-transporting ATPase ATPase C chain